MTDQEAEQPAGPAAVSGPDAPDTALIVQDRDGIIRSWSKGAEQLLGYGAAEVVGSSGTLLLPRGHDEEALIRARVARGEALSEYETTRVAKDGRRVDVSLTIAPLRDEIGGVIGASTTVRVLPQRDHERAQAQLAAIVDSSDDAILSRNLLGIIQTWNAGAERIFGYRAEEAIGRAITLLIPPDRISEEDEIFARIGRGERIQHHETVRLAKGGRPIDVSLTASPILGASGRVIGASTIARDISLRRHLDAVRARLAAIVDSADDPIISKDLQGIVLTWNRGAERVFGYTEAEAVGRSITFLIPPDRLAEEEYILSRVARGERVERYETLRLRKDGRPIDVELTISPIHDAQGRVIGVSKIVQDITERRRTEEARSRLAAIVDSSDDAIVSKNLDGIIQSWNRGAERIFGHTAEQAIGQSIMLVIPPDRHAEEREILDKISRGERVDHFETVRVTKDGRRIDVSLTISPVRNAAGKVVGASKVGRDVTERRQLERELAAQRERFRVTLASIGDAVIASDVEGRVTFLNAVAERLTGWPSAEAVGQPLAEVFQIIGEETRQRVENPAQKVIRSGAVIGLANHTALIHREGTEKPIADSAAPIFDDGGKIIGVVLSFRDITEERRAEEALHEQREWFEQTLQGIGDGVIATDIRGSIVFMNPVAEYLTGRKLEMARGTSWTDVFRVVHEKTRQPIESAIARVLREGKIEGPGSHSVLIDAEGNERYIDENGAPIRSQSGRLVGAVLVFRDVTERRRQELERAAAAAERERLLESERAARGEAERANRAKDDFVATLSHELRTPLNAILGWTQLLKSKEVLSDLLTRGIDVIERNTRVQAQLVSDLLDMSRIMSGKLSLELGSVDLPAIVDAAIETIQPVAQAKGVTVEVERDPAIGPVAGDAARLQQVVWNLLSNAVKFTPTGGRVDVRVERVDAEAHVVVRDTGIGMHADFLPALFERFRQAESSASRRFGGLGLGLAIVKQLVELHGGTVQAASEGEGRGSTFRVRLPIGSPRRASEERRGAQAAQGTAIDDELGLRGLRVLVVEDDADTADLLERFLRGVGGQPTVVHSASAALEAIRSVRPDIVVSDIGMPHVDGYELMRQIRKLDPGEGGMVPAIAVTAFARAEDRMRALLAGYQAHLTKPIDAAELVATVRTLAGLTLGRRSES